MNKIVVKYFKSSYDCLKFGHLILLYYGYFRTFFWKNDFGRPALDAYPFKEEKEIIKYLVYSNYNTLNVDNIIRKKPVRRAELWSRRPLSLESEKERKRKKNGFWYLISINYLLILEQ